MDDWSVEEKKANGGKSSKDKEGDDIDQVAGNAEDEIGDRMQHIRDEELLYGEDSLFPPYANMIVHICGSPQKYKVWFALGSLVRD